MNPYKTIWFAPKRTFASFFEDDKKQPVYFIPFLVLGISLAIDQTTEIGNLFGNGAPIWTALTMIPIGFGIVYLTIGLILPGLTKLFGSIWKGNSTLRQLTNVYAISVIPHCIILFYQVLLFATGKEPTIYNINTGVEYVLRLWTFGLLILGVARVQRFSYGFALLSILLAYVPFLIIALLIRS